MFEINLVPDVKAEMIKAQKLRNLVFFLSFMVAAISVGFVIFLGAIKTGQDIRMSSQDAQIKLMSEVAGEYDGLAEILTVSDQLDKLQEIGYRKKLLSRVFNMLDTILPSGADEITISKLNVDLDSNMMSFEAQARAGEEPRINYRVLEAFSKSLVLMRYDFGRYVDEFGNEIPTRCIIETSDDGQPLNENGALYAWWTKGANGCDPSRNDKESVDANVTGEDLARQIEAEETAGETITEGGTDLRVQIWRTPQFNQWHKTSNSEDEEENYMGLNGVISGVPHFQSQCITYSGVDTDGVIRWTTENSCNLVSDVVEGGIEVTESSDAVETSGERVLRFTAAIYFNEEIFRFTNKHMMTIAPSGKTNVTDSYIQIGEMFAERAEDIESEGAD